MALLNQYHLLGFLVIVAVISYFALFSPIPEAPSQETAEINTAERLANTNCVAAIPNHNRADFDRVNIIFVGFNVTKDAFVEFVPVLVDYNGSGFTTTFNFETKVHTESGEVIRFPAGSSRTFYGFLATEPFKSNRDKFNFWYIDQVQQVTRPSDAVKARSASCKVLCSNKIAETCGLKNLQVVKICNAACTPSANLLSAESFIGNLNPVQIRIFIHEFSHSFAGLVDEYPALGNRTSKPGYPNCAPSLEIGRKWWGDLEGQGNGILRVNYFNGCGYSEGNVKPTSASLMSANPLLALGSVNERHIGEILSFFSGQREEVTEKNLTAIVEQLAKRRT